MARHRQRTRQRANTTLTGTFVAIGQDAGLRHRVGAGRSARGDGVNDRAQLAQAEARPSRRSPGAAPSRGRRLAAPRRSHFSQNTHHRRGRHRGAIFVVSGRACPWGTGDDPRLLPPRGAPRWRPAPSSVPYAPACGRGPPSALARAPSGNFVEVKAAEVGRRAQGQPPLLQSATPSVGAGAKHRRGAPSRPATTTEKDKHLTPDRRGCVSIGLETPRVVTRPFSIA